jgi:hypothetical protein
VHDTERHSVFVAVVPQASVGDAGEYAKVEFDMITPGWCLPSALFAVAVGADARRLAVAAGRVRRRTGADHRCGEFPAAGLAEIVGGVC